MIFPKPFAVDILDATTAGRAIINNGLTGAQFGVESNSLTVTSQGTNDPILIFGNSGASGAGGEIFQIRSTLYATTGSPPFLFLAQDSAVNDDSSRNFVVGWGHGFDSAGTLRSGAQWGAAGFFIEGHYNPSGAINQSEMYTRHWSNRSAGLGGPEQYRAFSVTHVNHNVTDGTDTILTSLAGDTVTIYAADGLTTRLAIASGSATFADGLPVLIDNGTVTFTSTGVMQTTALNNTFSPTLTTDDHTCVAFNPVVNVSSGKTAFGTTTTPSWTGLTGASFVAHRDILYSSKAATLIGGYEVHPGVLGAVTIGTSFAYRFNPQVYTGTVSAMAGFWAMDLTVTGTLSGGKAVRVDNWTGHYSIYTAQGKISLGDNSANSLFGMFGATPVVKQTGVAVTAAGIHAALVNYGMIAA